MQGADKLIFVVNVCSELPPLLLMQKLDCLLCSQIVLVFCRVESGNVYRIRQSGLATSKPADLRDR